MIILFNRQYALLLIFISVALSGCIANTQNSDSVYILQHYNKQVYMVPMRAGVKLCTVVYSPIDTSAGYPILLNRTPY